jgi:hypothetical protein
VIERCHYDLNDTNFIPEVPSTGDEDDGKAEQDQEAALS